MLTPHSKKQYLHHKCTLIVLFTICIHGVSYAQAPEIGLWTGFNLEKNIRRSFSFHLNAQVRYRDNLAVRSALLGELGLSYKINKRWEITGYYRYISRRRWDEEYYKYAYQPFHRFYADLSYDQKFRKLKFEYRLRYQNQFEDDSDGLGQDKSHVRNKLEISYPNTSRFKPYLSADLFYRMGTGFNQLRNKAGILIEITKRQSIDLYGFSDYQFIEVQENWLNFGVMYRAKF
jgi:hypothetical protein